jgi:hypothetical protein
LLLLFIPPPPPPLLLDAPAPGYGRAPPDAAWIDPAAGDESRDPFFFDAFGMVVPLLIMEWLVWIGFVQTSFVDSARQLTSKIRLSTGRMFWSAGKVICVLHGGENINGEDTLGKETVGF